jgi:hypothetical protein
MCMWLFGSVRTFFKKNLHVIELSHFSSMFWIDHTYFVYSTPPMPFGWHSSSLAQLLWTHWRCACDFLEVFGQFSKNLHVVGLKSFFQHVLNRWHLHVLCVINSSHIFRLTFFKPCTVVHWRCACDFLEDYRHYLKNLPVHIIELSHFSSMFWINCIYHHQLITFTIMDKCFRAAWPFYSWIDFRCVLGKTDLWSRLGSCTICCVIVHTDKMQTFDPTESLNLWNTEGSRAGRPNNKPCGTWEFEV